MQALLCALLLLGVALLSNSCKRDLEIRNQPQLALNRSILKAKTYVDSVVMQQGANAFVKKMGFEILWEKAIVDSANNVRVPINFDLNKLKPKEGKQLTSAKTKDVFELYVRKQKGKIEASIMQFISIKGKYYPLRFNLTGEIKTDLKGYITTQDVKVLKEGNRNKILSSTPNKTMMYESEFVGLIQSMYGSQYQAILIYECQFGNYFDPITCICDYPENVTTGAFYPEIFMVLVPEFGPYETVPYLFSFHPSSVSPDPTYPGGPIEGGGNPNPGNGDGGGNLSYNDIMNQTNSIESSSDDYTVEDLHQSDSNERPKAYSWVIAYNPFVYWKVISHETGTHKKVNGEWQWKKLEHNNFSVIDNLSIISITVTENGQAIPTMGIYYAGIEVGCNVKATIAHESIPIGASPKNYRKTSPLFFSNTP